MTEQLSNKDELGSSFPVTRRALINGYVVAAIVLLLVPCTSFIEALVNASTPTIHLDPIPFALLFAALICAGICCGNRARSKTLRVAGLFVACTTTAYCLSALAVTTFVGWLDFTDRVNDLDDLDVFVGRSIAGFFEKHPPQQAFGLGLWSLLTPVALLLFVILLATLARRFLAKGDLAERLAITIILAAVGSSAFLLGSMLTSERFPRSEVEVGNLVFPIAPIVMLGALSAWSYVNLRATVAPKRNSRSARSAVDVEKVLSQVSQISIIILVLLYFRHFADVRLCAPPLGTNSGKAGVCSGCLEGANQRRFSLEHYPLRRRQDCRQVLYCAGSLGNDRSRRIRGRQRAQTGGGQRDSNWRGVDRPCTPKQSLRQYKGSGRPGRGAL